MDSFERQMGAFEQMIDGYLIISEHLKGVAARLVKEGWNEGQAKDIAVAGFVMSMRPQQ
jgi:hypothetical protein